MFEQKKMAEDGAFFSNLFNLSEKDNDDELYKKQLYVLKEDIDEKINQNSLKFKHDVLLSKLMLEDYNEFPPKIAQGQVKTSANEKENNKEDDTEKLQEQENEFLRELHRINYLTFSPFALNFFDNFAENTENKVDKESEDKLLKMINFSYDSFEVNNDLLFNICQGFVDINKLKEDNLAANQQVSLTEGVKSTMPTEANAPKDESDDEELNNSVINFVMDWAKNKITSGAGKAFVGAFLSDLENLPKNCKKKEKNTFFGDWKNKINCYEAEVQAERQKLRETERRREEEERRKQMEIQKQLQKELEAKKEDEEKKQKEEERNRNKNQKRLGNQSKSKSKSRSKSKGKPNQKKKKPKVSTLESKGKKPLAKKNALPNTGRDSWLNKKSYNLLENY